MADRRIILPIIAIAVAIVLCAGYVVMSSGSSGSDGPAIDMDMTADGDSKTVDITSSSGIFKEGIGAGDVSVYYIPLNEYLDQYNVFDTAAFVEAMEKESIYDEGTGEYIPSASHLVSDIKVTFVDKTAISIGFTVPGDYACCVVKFLGTGLEGLEGFMVNTYNLPDPEYVDTTPVMSVIGDIYDNIEGPTITVKVENTVFVSGVSAGDIELGGDFGTLSVVSVKRVDACTLSIKTSGFMGGSTSYIGYVYALADATEYGEKITATAVIKSTCMRIDDSSFALADDALSFRIIVSEDIIGSCRGIVFDGIEYPTSQASEADLNGYRAIPMTVSAFGKDIDAAVAALNGQTITAVSTNGGAALCEYTVSIVTPVAGAYVDSYSEKGNGLELNVRLYVMGGYLSSISAGDLKLECGISGAAIASCSNDIVRITIPEYDGRAFGACITIGKGIMNPWGTDSGAQTVRIAFSSNDSEEITTDDMVKGLYEYMKFSEVFDYVEMATGGIEGVVSILGMFDIIDTRTTQEIQIQQILINTEQIKDMLADQAIILDKMNKKLDDIKGLLQQAEINRCSDIYTELKGLGNKLSTMVKTYSDNVRQITWGMVLGDYDGETIHIYVATDGKITVMQNSLFQRTDVGKSIDGKDILPEYTIEIPIVEDETFADARTETGYNSRTEKNMIACLVKAVEEKYGKEYVIEVDGKVIATYTSEQLGKAVFDGITVKIAQHVAKTGIGYDIVKAYNDYVERMGNLIVKLDGTIVIDADVGSNPVACSQKIVKTKYNFESEARAGLKALNDSMTLSLYQVTILASEIQQLQGVGTKSEKNHYEAAIKFLKDHRGYRADTSKSSADYVEYCYVTNSYVQSKQITLATKVEVTSKNGFDTHVYSPPKTLIGLKSAGELGIPSSYVNTSTFNKIKSNYDRLKDKTKEVTVSFDAYITFACGGKIAMENRYVITSFDGGEYYGDSREVELYSFTNFTSDHKNQLVKAGKNYVIKGTVDKVSIYKAYSKDIYNKVAYKGDLYDLWDASYKKVKAYGSTKYIYAAGYYCDHVSAWTYDEGADMGARSSIACINSFYGYIGENCRQYTIYGDYLVISTFS